MKSIKILVATLALLGTGCFDFGSLDSCLREPSACPFPDGGLWVGDVKFDDVDAILASDLRPPSFDLMETPKDIAIDLMETPKDIAIMTVDMAEPPGPLSCTALAKTCGPGGNDDCCRTLPVPSGTFLRSFDATPDYPNQSFPATVSNFRLDRYEATVGRIRRFAAAVGAGWRPAHGIGAHPKIPGSGWEEDGKIWPFSAATFTQDLKCDPNRQTWTDPIGANENLPINCVDWYIAFAFCAWDGGRLPTEAEWNYAAAGGSEQRAYPWSNPPNSTAIDDTQAVYCGGTCAIQKTGSRSPKGDGKWGHADLAGNVWEWTLDWSAAYANPCVDCANLIESTQRTLRGGSFSQPLPTSGPWQLRTANRTSVTPLNRDNSSGFRCARP